jgi:hypothetical protein
MDFTNIPDAIYEGDLEGEFIIAVAACVARDMDESAWKKFATRFPHLEDMTVERDRFLRSLKWDDDDHEGFVIDLIKQIFPSRPSAIFGSVNKTNHKPFFDLFGRPGVQRRFRNDHEELAALWTAEPDHLVDAIAHGVSEVDAVASVIDLSEYRDRIHAALPGDPKLAIGATKDMLEATMRTIMDARSKPVGKNMDFPTLVTRCMTELGLTPNTAPADDAERHIRKIANAAKAMIESANEFRNAAGTGHGRTIGKEQDVTADDASLVASSGFILAAWLLRRHRTLGL